MYPFKSVELKYNISEFGPQSGTDKESLPTGFMMAGQFFVVWGIFSFFYGIIALLVYMLTTANAGIEWIVNFLVLTVSVFIVTVQRIRGGGGEVPHPLDSVIISSLFKGNAKLLTKNK